MKLGIEVDGWRWHADAQRNSRDMQRQNVIGIAGWFVLRYDWHRLNNDGPGVVAEIEAALKTRKTA